MADPTIFTDEFNSIGGISLREAIRDTPSGGTIRLAAGVYQLSLMGSSEDLGETGDFDLDGKTLTIEGIDDTTTIIEWPMSLTIADRDRLFHLFNSAQLTLRNVTLRNGYEFAGGDGGGAIFIQDSSSKLILEASTLSGNAAPSEPGGAIHSKGYFSIVDSQFLNNVAPGGGAIYTQNTSSTNQIISSTISGNQSSSNGGGISNEGKLRIDATTILNNSSLGRGGGISNGVSATDLTLQNSTISGNAAVSAGGGGYFKSPATIVHSTIAVNRTYGTYAAVGGLAISSSGVTLTLQNSIVTNSVGGADVGVFPAPGGSSFVFNGRNIIKDGSVTGVGVLSVDPLLEPLKNNGGNVQTYALKNGSPAIDAAIGSSLTVDQRGFLRDTQPDLGAYEFSTIDIITFFETAGSTQAIEGLTDADVYAVRLGVAPTQPVTITFSFNNTALNLNTTSLTFTPTNWNTPQFVILSIGDNRTNDGTRTIDIIPSSTSDDSLFQNPPLSNLGVTIIDNDRNPGTTRDLANTPNSAIVINTGDDIVTGSIARDFIISRDGDDLLLGLGGNDYLLGNNGNDGISGGEGNDYLSGRLGDDYLSGGEGFDVLYGGDGNDLLYGGNGDDLLSGGNDGDQLYGGLGNDTLIGGLGSDTYSLDTQSIDRIRDFSFGDTLQLLDGSGFGDVAIEAGSGDFTGSAVVRILSRNQIVAVLENVSPGLVTEFNFFT